MISPKNENEVYSKFLEKFVEYLLKEVPRDNDESIIKPITIEEREKYILKTKSIISEKLFFYLAGRTYQAVGMCVCYWGCDINPGIEKFEKLIGIK